MITYIQVLQFIFNYYTWLLRLFIICHVSEWIHKMHTIHNTCKQIRIYRSLLQTTSYKINCCKYCVCDTFWIICTWKKIVPLAILSEGIMNILEQHPRSGLRTLIVPLPSVLFYTYHGHTTCMPSIRTSCERNSVQTLRKEFPFAHMLT